MGCCSVSILSWIVSDFGPLNSMIWSESCQRKIIHLFELPGDF